MTDTREETGYTRPPSRRERELTKAETEVKKLLDMLDSDPEVGILKSNIEEVKRDERRE